MAVDVAMRALPFNASAGTMNALYNAKEMNAELVDLITDTILNYEGEWFADSVTFRVAYDAVYSPCSAAMEASAGKCSELGTE